MNRVLPEKASFDSVYPNDNTYIEFLKIMRML